MIVDDQRATDQPAPTSAPATAIATFKKRFPGAGAVPANDLIEKHYPGQALLFRSPRAECATCLRDSYQVVVAELTGGRLSEAEVQRQFPEGPWRPDFLAAWNQAFVETVRAALSGRLVTIEDKGSGRVDVHPARAKP